MIKQLMKTIIVFGFLLWNSSSLCAQTYRELVMDTISQMADTWCWAASAEMIMKFYHPSLTDSALQPVILKKYSATKDWEFEKECIDCNGNLHKLFVKKITSKCDFSIDPSRYESLFIDYMDQIFHSFGYFSSQEVNADTLPISWERLKKQIDDCRPFIVFIDPLDGQGISSNHAIVAKGYYIIDDSIKYIIANDPWSTCDKGRETIFPYENFLQQADEPLRGLSIERILSTVMEIRPSQIFNNADDCISCAMVTAAMQSEFGGTPSCVMTDLADFTRINHLENESRTSIGGATFTSSIDTIKEKPRDNRLIVTLVNNSDQILGFKENVIINQKLDTFLQQEKHFAANVKYLSVDKLNKCLIFHRPNRIAKTVDHLEEVVDVVSGSVSPNIVSTFQKYKSGTWHLKAITDFTLLKDKIEVKMNGTQNSKITVLSNLRGEDKIIGSKPYELIKIPPFQYEFFSFRVDDQNYMTPASYYPELKLEEYQAYSESKVIGKLRKATNGILKQDNIGFLERLKILFGSSKYRLAIHPSLKKSKI